MKLDKVQERLEIMATKFQVQPNFWITYINLQEYYFFISFWEWISSAAGLSTGQLRDVYTRACEFTIYENKQLLLMWSLFEYAQFSATGDAQFLDLFETKMLWNTYKFAIEEQSKPIDIKKLNLKEPKGLVIFLGLIVYHFTL